VRVVDVVAVELLRVQLGQRRGGGILVQPRRRRTSSPHPSKAILLQAVAYQHSRRKARAEDVSPCLPYASRTIANSAVPASGTRVRLHGDDQQRGPQRALLDPVQRETRSLDHHGHRNPNGTRSCAGGCAWRKATASVLRPHR